MAYEVLARKWRPRQFDDVVGQEHVTRTLRNAIREDRLAHAYLFVGPRGIGKTSLARIFAEAINCEQGPTETPCGKCGSCREIAAGNNLDVLEIDGASNNRVEEVRDLRENVKFLPARGRYKIYIIDEVHMLTTPAFNALLKTLEDRPPHVKFILATTEPQKILPTILSRCQRFDLRRITIADIVARLRLIAEAEGISAGDDALAAVARAAEGSLRDAVSALDQLRSFKGDAIEEDDVLSVFGLVSRRTLWELAGAVLEGDMRRIISTVHELESSGKDMQRLLIELLEHFRNVLVMLHAPEGADDGRMLDDQAETVRRQAADSDSERLLRITDLMIEAEPRLRYALSRRTILETTLIRCARAATTVSIDQIIARLDALGVAPPVTPPVTPPAADARASAHSPSVPPADDPKKKTRAVGLNEQELGQRLTAEWHTIVEAVARGAPMAKAALLGARPLDVGAGRVSIGLDPEFAADLERIKHVRTQRAMQRVLENYFGAVPEITLRLMTEEERTAAGQVSEPVPAAGKTAGPVSEEPASGKTRPDWRDDPAVRNTLDVFRGTVVEVRD